MNTILLRLEGPLQAWGTHSHWKIRDTADVPTKSGVIGLLATAMGLPRGDPRLFHMCQSMSMGVRIDRPGQVLVDYHTVGGRRQTFEQHRPHQEHYTDEPYVGGVPSALVVKGRTVIKVTPGNDTIETDVSERYYLSDASFAVAIRSDDAQDIERIGQSLREPVWPPFLGRKACVPAKPIYSSMGTFADLIQALQSEPLLWDARWPLKAIVETTSGNGTVQYDNIVNPAKRTFGPRHVREVWIEGPSSDGEHGINTMKG